MKIIKFWFFAYIVTMWNYNFIPICIFFFLSLSFLILLFFPHVFLYFLHVFLIMWIEFWVYAYVVWFLLFDPLCLMIDLRKQNRLLMFLKLKYEGCYVSSNNFCLQVWFNFNSLSLLIIEKILFKLLRSIKCSYLCWRMHELRKQNAWITLVSKSLWSILVVGTWKIHARFIWVLNLWKENTSIY